MSPLRAAGLAGLGLIALAGYASDAALCREYQLSFVGDAQPVVPPCMFDHEIRGAGEYRAACDTPDASHAGPVNLLVGVSRSKWSFQRFSHGENRGSRLEEWPPGPFRKLKEAGYTGLWMMRVYKYI